MLAGADTGIVLSLGHFFPELQSVRKAPFEGGPQRTQESWALTLGFQPPFSEILASPSPLQPVSSPEKQPRGALCPPAQKQHYSLCFSPSSGALSVPGEVERRGRGQRNATSPARSL